MIREPPDYTRNEPTLDIPIGGSVQDIKKEHDGKYVAGMSIHPFSTEFLCFGKKILHCLIFDDVIILHCNTLGNSGFQVKW